MPVCPCIRPFRNPAETIEIELPLKRCQLQTEVRSDETRQTSPCDLTLVCRKYLGKISVTKRSASLTENASPLGSHATTEGSSLRSISISFRGNGFECPVEAGDDVADNEGDDDKLEEAVLVMRRFGSIIPRIGEAVGTPGGIVGAAAMEGWILITPAATLLSNGTTTALPPEATGADGCC